MKGDGSLRFEDAKDGDIRHVALAGCGEGAIERDIESCSFGVALKILNGSGLRAHSMTTGGPDADAI